MGAAGLAFNVKLTPDDESILEALERAGASMTAKQLSEATGINYDRSLRSVRWLRKFGHLEKTDGGRYARSTLTD